MSGFHFHSSDFDDFPAVEAYATSSQGSISLAFSRMRRYLVGEHATGDYGAAYCVEDLGADVERANRNAIG